MGDERGLDERRLDEFFKHCAGDFKVFVFFADFGAQIVGALTTFSRRNFKPICARFFAD